ncbi:MAG: hypothetical protein KBD56_09215 [Candidatus Eisenbacteria bacterium]|nr:hypothetical protein [Candidatus Eisenbacteria bacterium]
MLEKTGSGFFVLFLAIALVAGCPVSANAQCSGIPPLTVLPDEGVCQGLTQSETIGEANSIEELVDFVEDTSLYEDYGFVAGAFLAYSGQIDGEPLILELSVFNQGLMENAQALFVDPRSGSGEVILDWPGDGPARWSFVSAKSVTLQFQEACFFVIVNSPMATPESAERLRCLGEETLEGIRAATPVHPESWGAIKLLWRSQHR